LAVQDDKLKGSVTPYQKERLLCLIGFLSPIMEFEELLLVNNKRMQKEKRSLESLKKS
jgi:hypothetical protein